MEKSIYGDGNICPRCLSNNYIKNGIVNGKQRYRCKCCNYHFTVFKLGKRIESFYIIKAIQLYMEGLSYRSIEKLLGISHSTIRNWVTAYGASLKPLLTGIEHAYLEEVDMPEGEVKPGAADDYNLYLVLTGRKKKFRIKKGKEKD